MYRPKLSPAGGKAMLEDLVTTNLLANMRAMGADLVQQESAAASSNSSNPSGSSEDLLPHLVRNVLDLEKDNASLREQLQLAQQSCGCPDQQQETACPAIPQPMQQQHEVQHLQSEVQRLRQQCKTAWQQVADIKAFLQDYGLVWVGDSPPADAAATAAGSTPAAAPSTNTATANQSPASSLPFDVAELQLCIDELNEVAGDGIGQLRPLNPTAASSNSSRAKTLGLYTPEPIKLIIYSDSMQLHTAPARPYEDPTTDAILLDIFDGYFPSVLRREFPEGTPLQLVDRSQVSMAAATAAGKGNKSGNSNIRSLDDIQQQGVSSPPGALGPNEFLQKLPKTVIKNQLVVPVKAAVEQYLTGSTGSSSSNGSTPVPATRSSSGVGRVYIRTNSSSRRGSRDDGSSLVSPSAAISIAQSSSSNAPAQQQPVQQQQQTTIQVKSENGKQTFVLKLPYSATVASLRALIDRHRASSGFKCTVCQQAGESAGAKKCSYELRSAFPARVHRDIDVTLESAGLTPSATLFMQHC